MKIPKSVILAPLFRFATRLRFPYLFLITLVLLALDVLIPDMLPFVDEIGLGLITLLLAMWKRRRRERSDE